MSKLRLVCSPTILLHVTSPLRGIIKLQHDCTTPQEEKNQSMQRSAPESYCLGMLTNHLRSPTYARSSSVAYPSMLAPLALVPVRDRVTLCNGRYISRRLLLRRITLWRSRSLAIRVLTLVFFSDLGLRAVHRQVVGRALLSSQIRGSGLESWMV
jgi:hypothetical protein